MVVGGVVTGAGAGAGAGVLLLLVSLWASGGRYVDPATPPGRGCPRNFLR